MFINEIVWHKPGGGIPTDRLSQKTDFILLYGFNILYSHQYEPYKTSFNKHATGKPFDRERGKHVGNMWDTTPLRAIHSVIDYPTQKPPKLLKRIICLGTK